MTHRYRHDDEYWVTRSVCSECDDRLRADLKEAARLLADAAGLLRETDPKLVAMMDRLIERVTR